MFVDTEAAMYATKKQELLSIPSQSFSHPLWSYFQTMHALFMLWVSPQCPCIKGIHSEAQKLFE